MKPYRLSNRALNDLDALWLYISENNAAAADRVVDEILTTCATLAEMPGIGHARQDLTPAALRFFSVGKYLIVYQPNTEPLEIYAIVHGAATCRASWTTSTDRSAQAHVSRRPIRQHQSG